MAPLAPPVAGGTRGPAPADLEVLAPWAPELADTFVALACDLALVVDGQGSIVRLAQDEAHPIAHADWLGRPWIDVVDTDSRPKVAQMLADVAAHGHATRREINHRGVAAASVPMACTAARLGHQGPLLVVAHDLRAVSALQQRFVAAQEALERSYWNAQAQGADRGGRPERPDRPERGASRKAPAPDPTLVDAVGRLVEQVVREQWPGPSHKAKHLMERHFLERAIQRAGSVEALAKALRGGRRGMPRRSRG